MLAKQKIRIGLSFDFSDFLENSPFLRRSPDAFLPDDHPPVNIGHQFRSIRRKRRRDREEMFQINTASAFVPETLVFLGPGGLTGPLDPVVQYPVYKDCLIGQEKKAEVGFEVLATKIFFLKRIRKPGFPVYLVPMGSPNRQPASRIVNDLVQQE